MSDVVAGWYPDPSGRFDTRFHNGSAWTADVSSDGQRYVDPLGTAPPEPGRSPEEDNKPATAAMVFGIIALAIGWMPFIVVFGAIAAVLALVLGTAGLKRSKVSGTGRSFALTGIITGAVGLAACVAGVIFSLVVFDAIDRYENPASHESTITSCDLNDRTATLVGEITNLDIDAADFSVKVAFVRPGTNNVQHSTRIAIDNVPAGETVSFGVDRRVTLDQIDCAIRSVDGPLPFGLEID